jgi:hypothetical protein
MIIIEQTNSVPYAYGSGNAGKLLGPSLPNVPNPQTNDSCICDFIQCEYVEYTFASPANPTELWKNDQSEFLYKRFIVADTVAIELHKDDVKVADLNTNTYGTFFNGFPSGSAEQQLYVGYLVDWKLVYTAFGSGNYKVVANLNIISNATVSESRVFRLALYSDILSNGTVRVESYQDGNIFGNSFDFTGLNWYQSLRLPGRFGNPTPVLETTEYVTSQHKRKQNKATMSREWDLETRMISWEVADKLIYNKMLGNVILITDYNIKAEAVWREQSVVLKELDKPKITGNPKRRYNLKFTDSEIIFTKRNF